MGVNITFLGGANTITGSKYLVRHDGHSLLVDCVLFQGYKQLRLRNRARGALHWPVGARACVYTAAISAYMRK